MSDEVESLAITVGGTIAATTTIDAIMTSVFPTRTADLAGTPVYTWIGVGPPVLAATWPTATTDQGKCVQLLARFEVHSILPSTAGP
jgi:hypothetical protein